MIGLLECNRSKVRPICWFSKLQAGHSRLASHCALQHLTELLPKPVRNEVKTCHPLRKTFSAIFKNKKMPSSFAKTTIIATLVVYNS